MKRELDEIEAEMGKERTMPWCTYTGNGCYKHPRQYASDCLDCPYFKECIPVEPERVKIEGCTFHDGHGDAPGLLQRMGMATWEEDEKAWAVFFQPMLMTWAEAFEFAGRYESAKVFRWQDGLR